MATSRSGKEREEQKGGEGREEGRKRSWEGMKELENWEDSKRERTDIWFIEKLQVFHLELLPCMYMIPKYLNFRLMRLLN